MSRKQFQGAYSQRYSNMTTSTAQSTYSSSGQPIQFRVVTTANNRGWGNVGIIKLASFKEDLLAQKTDQERYSRFTPEAGNLYDKGTVIRVTAQPKTGYRFVSWSSASYIPSAAQHSPSFDVTVNGNMTFIANFEKVPEVYHTVRVSFDSTKGNVTASDNSLNNGAAVVRDGDSITLTATAKSGYKFAGWQGDNLRSSMSPTITISVVRDLNLTAKFEAVDPGTGGGSGGGSEEPGTGGGSGGGTVDPGTGGGSGGGTTIVASSGFNLKAMLKKYWWVLAIIAVWYLNKEGKL